MIGVGVLSVGFIVMALFGTQYQDITIQTKEFSECYDYTNDDLPVKIDCDEQLQDRNLMFAIVIGILLLITLVFWIVTHFFFLFD